MRNISFISANYVARVLGYNGEENWGAHDRATRELMLREAASPEHFAALADDVADAGFTAIDIWMGHCPPGAWELAERIEEICAERGLDITSYAGGFNVEKAGDFDAPFSTMQRLGAPIFAGGISGPLPDRELAALANDACQKYGVRWGFENHPQKTAAEMLARIGGGEYAECGMAIDTGWCGTQGLDALEAVQAVRDRLFILHLKDVRQPGGHDTCALGEGVVPCEAIVRSLVQSNWNGTICIEHEPYDRDPMPEVRRSLQRVRQWLA